jgi:5-methylcytosine-specific restriction endonuclease McrA
MEVAALERLPTTCVDCGAATEAIPSHVKRALCDECRTARRLAAKARYRETHRDELRAKGLLYTRLYNERNREAVNEKARERRAANPEWHRESVRRWREGHPEQKEKDRQAIREWRAANPELAKERERVANRRYYQRHKDEPEHRSRAYAHGHIYRARRRGAARVEKIDRYAIYDRDGGQCHLCGRSVGRKAFHLDHLVPLSRGGDHITANVAVAHAFCNLSRNAGRTPAQLRLIG